MMELWQMTKIETDVGWLKNSQASKEKGCCDNESSVDVD